MNNMTMAYQDHTVYEVPNVGKSCV